MNSIDNDARKEASRLVTLVMGCRVPAMGTKPSQGVGRYLARELAKKIVEEKNYPEEHKKKILSYLSLKQW